MQETRTKKRALLVYIIYGMLLMFFLLYYRFPSTALMNHIESTFQKKYPGYTLSIEKTDIDFPPGISFLNARVFKNHLPEIAFFETKHLKTRPDLISLFRDRQRFRFDCTAYEGNISGYFGIKETNTEPIYDTSISISDIDLEKYPVFSKMLGHEIKGILNGRIDIKDHGIVFFDGKGEINLTISKGRLEVVKPIIGINSVNFDNLLMNLLIEKGRVELREVEIKGREIQGSLSGNIILKEDISNSSLNIRGTVEPMGGLVSRLGSGSRSMKLLRRRLRNGRLSFRISGTFESPRFNFT